MLTKLTETITAIQHAIHITKPLIFEMVLFLWASFEMVKFLWQQIGGES